MKYVLSLICLLSLFSCYPRSEFRRSTIKFEGGNTNIRDLIEIDGFYSDSLGLSDAARMFFEDGSCVYFSFQSETSEKERQTNMFQTLETWKGGKQIRWGLLWGVYTIQNDTIIIHEALKPPTMSPRITERRYKVVDRSTIRIIYIGDILVAKDRPSKTRNLWINNTPIYFIPADSLPPSDNWLKERKWNWRNKSDWKAYVQMIKQKKKQFRKKEVKTYW